MLFVVAIIQMQDKKVHNSLCLKFITEIDMQGMICGHKKKQSKLQGSGYDK